MRDRTEGTAGGAGLPHGLRYLPATLVAASIAAAFLLVPAATDWIRPAFYGAWLKVAGPPPPSRMVVLVTRDEAEASLAPAEEGEELGRLSAALLAMQPAALALDLPPGLPFPAPAGTASAAPVVLGGELGAGGLAPQAAARAAYPNLDAPGRLRLPEAGSLGLPASLPWRSATAAFAGPLAGRGAAYAFPAFARLERGAAAGLGVEAARRALGVPAAAVTHVEGVGVLFDPAHLLPVDAEGRMHLRFHEAAGIPAVRASDVLAGAARPEDIRGRTVFVARRGAQPVRTVAGFLDPAEIWATAASNLLEKGTVSAPSWGRILAVTLGIAFAAIVLAVHFADIGLLLSLAIAALLAALYPALSLWLFVKSSWWLPPELPALLVPAAWLPFAATRLLAGRRPSAAPASAPARPVPVYDPMVAMGGGPMRPASPAGTAPGQGPARSTPPRGIPRTPAAAPSVPPTPPRGVPQTPPAQQAPAGPAALSPAVQAAQQGQFVPESQRPRPSAPRERQGPAAPPAPPAPPFAPPAGEFRDPRDPPVVASPPAAAAPGAIPSPRPSVPPAMPYAHSGSISDDIERDAKGGLVRVGKYRIVRKMGFGSGGDVFEGFDTHMGRKVAIKTITKEAAAHFDRAAERFVVEAKAAGSLNHPCINTIYDFGTIREVSYMVLEYLDGVTLSQWMRQNPIPSPRAAAPWIQQICSALDYAHSQKVIHRDLKPANLMVVHGGATIKLLDFGIAKLEDVGLTQTGMTVGTPSYMSPEQLTGTKVTAASDQYGLAVVLYQLFTYKLPYQGTKIPELCNRILKNEIIPITDANPSLGTAFWDALRRSLSKAPEERYPSCMALFQALEAAFPAPQPATPA